MGERVRGLGAEEDPKDAADFIDRFEALCESMYEDRENGGVCSYSVSIKAKGKKGFIPRGIGQIVNDSTFAIPLLIAEIRRREADPFRTMTTERFVEGFVRWADGLPTEDWKTVIAFLEAKRDNRPYTAGDSDPVTATSEGDEKVTLPEGAVGLCGVPGCGLPVFETPSGTTCDAGHGGADIVGEWGVESEAEEARQALREG